MKLLSILTLAAGVVGLTTSGFAQSVSVNSAGGANFTTIRDALWHVQNDPSGPDVVTIQNVGPYIETVQLNINGDANASPLTLQASSPAIRPIVTYSGTGRLFQIQKVGAVLIRDLIILPGSSASNTAQVFTVDDISTSTATGYDVTLRNILVTANNGSNQPLGSLDGLTSPTYDFSIHRSFTRDVLNAASNLVTQVNKLYLYDVIVTGLVSDGNLNGFRGFPDGAAGSEWVIGEGCVVSYCSTSGSGNPRGAWQPGGNDGAPFTAIAKVVGTQAKPVKFVNNGNMHGVHITGNSTNAIKHMEWAIIANNGLCGIDARAISNEFVGLQNVTVANNGLTPGDPLHEAYRAAAAFSKDHATTNTILAGNGTATPTNVVNVLTSVNTGILHLVNSAVVTNGPFTLDTASTGGDGILENTPSNVVATGLVNADPQFASLDPASPNFATVKNTAYGTAGPGGTPLRGGGAYNPAAAVADWGMY